MNGCKDTTCFRSVCLLGPRSLGSWKEHLKDLSLCCVLKVEWWSVAVKPKLPKHLESRECVRRLFFLEQTTFAGRETSSPAALQQRLREEERQHQGFF